jgi:hypothetical protein
MHLHLPITTSPALSYRDGNGLRIYAGSLMGWANGLHYGLMLRAVLKGSANGLRKCAAELQVMCALNLSCRNASDMYSEVQMR